MTVDDSDEALSWVGDRGFGVAAEERDGIWWAHLTNEAGAVVAPNYGSGRTRAMAVKRARDRYKQEQ